MLEKVKWIIENIDINNESYLVFSDCDVQFFKNIDIDLSDYDILFQNDYMHDAYCAGFFIMKQNNKTMDFFTLVRDTFLSMMNGRVDDQSIVNMLLKKGVKDLKYGFLPSGQYWTVAYATNGRAWTGEDISCPDSLVAHHANWTIGVNNKMDLLQLVKSKQIQS